MQVDINNKNPFPKIIFDMKPGEMRKVLSDKMHSGAADAQGAFRSGSAAVPSKEERAALEERWSHTVIHGTMEFLRYREAC